MSRREEYLASNSEWAAELTRDERLAQWWSRASFGLALSSKASSAADAAKQAVVVAEAARDLVLHQAVYALLEEGKSVRVIANHLCLSKSQIGRMVKQLTTGGTAPNLDLLACRGSEAAIRASVLSAWRFSDLDNTVVDHSCAISGVEPPPEHTNPVEPNE